MHRDQHAVLEKIKVLAAAAGADWYYRFPVKTKGRGTDWIEGPSIKLANDLAREYGNCDVDTRVTDLGDSWLIYARFTDFETGFSMTRPFQQRKSQRGMKTGDERALDIAFAIGASKAIRNVVCNSLQTFADFAFTEARNALVEKVGKNLAGWRDRAVQGLANKQIELPRVERVIGRAAKDWTAPDVAKAIAMMQSIADGMTTVDEAFPPPGADDEDATEQQSTGKPRANEALERFAETPSQPTQDAEVRDGADEQGAAVANRRAPAAPDEEAVRVAYEKGKQHRAAGHQRKAMPGEYRDPARSREAVAWTAGFEGQAMPGFEAGK